MGAITRLWRFGFEKRALRFNWVFCYSAFTDVNCPTTANTGFRLLLLLETGHSCDHLVVWLAVDLAPLPTLLSHKNFSASFKVNSDLASNFHWITSSTRPRIICCRTTVLVWSTVWLQTSSVHLILYPHVLALAFKLATYVGIGWSGPCIIFCSCSCMTNFSLVYGTPGGGR